jgi:hypothetical protein
MENIVLIIVEDSVTMRSSLDVIKGTISLKYVKEATFIIIVDKPIKIARVVIIAVDIRQATVLGWSIIIKSRSASPFIIFKLL